MGQRVQSEKPKKKNSHSDLAMGQTVQQSKKILRKKCFVLKFSS